MQAHRQNTRVLAPGVPELMEWVPTGANTEWSLINYGPGILWFSYTSDIIAGVGREDCTRLVQGNSFTQSAPRKTLVQLSLAAEGDVCSYCLDTNWRFAGTGGPGRPPEGGIDEAPVDGKLYGRRSMAWDEAASKPEVDGKVDKAGDTMTGPLTLVDPVSLIPSLTLDGSAGAFLRLLRSNRIHWMFGFQDSILPDALGIFRFDQSGVYLDTPLLIAKADGRITLRDVTGGRFTTNAGNPVTDNELARKAYVDGLFPTGGFVLRSGDTMTGGLVIRRPNSVAPFLQLDGSPVFNPDLSFTSEGAARWTFVPSFTGTFPEGAGFYLFRLNGATVLDWPLFISYADGFIRANRILVRGGNPVDPDELTRKAYVDSVIPDITGKVNKAGDIMTGPLVVSNGTFESHRVVPNAIWNTQSMILCHSFAGINQTDVAGEVAIVFLNYNNPANGGFRIGKIVLNRLADQFDLRNASTNNPIDLGVRHVIGSGLDPTLDNHLTRKAYVDRRDEETAAGLIQTIPVLGTGWSGTPILSYRLLNNGENVQLQAQLGRLTGNFIPPGAPGVTLCTLPAGFRPRTQQVQMVMCQGGQAVTDPSQFSEYGILLLSPGGQVMFYGHAGALDPPAAELRHTQTIYISNVFSLTI